MKINTMPKIRAIVVVDQNWGIGKDGKLLTHLPADLKYFRRMTEGKRVIMGRETFDSIDQPLQGRETLVLSTNKGIGDHRVFHSFNEICHYIKCGSDEEVVVAGGEAIYRLFLPYCDIVSVTKLHHTFEADRHFPNIDEDPNFVPTRTNDVCEENGIKYQFVEYLRNYEAYKHGRMYDPEVLDRVVADFCMTTDVDLIHMTTIEHPE